MNYSKGIQPSCCSKTEYEAENRKLWNDLEKSKPNNGAMVFVLHKNGSIDPWSWTIEPAYYCEGEFYKLDYDPHLGVLRKQHISGVDYWKDWIEPPLGELVN